MFPSVIPLPKVVQNLYCEFKELRYFSLVTCSVERDFQKCAFKFALRIYRWKMNVVLKKRFKRLPFTYEVLRLAADFWHLGRCFSSFESQLFHCCLACIYRFDQPRILKFSATLTFALVLHQKVPSGIFFFCAIVCFVVQGPFMISLSIMALTEHLFFIYGLSLWHQKLPILSDLWCSQ